MIKKIKAFHFVRFMAFMPALTSDLIDRFWKFEKDYQKLPSQVEYLKMISQAINYLFLGFYLVLLFRDVVAARTGKTSFVLQSAFLLVPERRNVRLRTLFVFLPAIHYLRLLSAIQWALKHR